jgi:hypothetical protein
VSVLSCTSPDPLILECLSETNALAYISSRRVKVLEWRHHFKAFSADILNHTSQTILPLLADD